MRADTAVMEGVSSGVHLDLMVARGIWRVRVVRWRYLARASRPAVFVAAGAAAVGSVEGERRRLGGFFFEGLADDG